MVPARSCCARTSTSFGAAMVRRRIPKVWQRWQLGGSAFSTICTSDGLPPLESPSRGTQGVASGDYHGGCCQFPEMRRLVGHDFYNCFSGIALALMSRHLP